MFRPKPFLVTILLTLACYPAFGQSSQSVFSSAQPIQITGYLRYADGSPANEVVVRLERFSGGYVTDVRTDRLGKFRFTGLSPQQYHVVIRHPGYRDIEREVNLVMVAAENLQLALIPDKSEVGNKPPPVTSKLVLDASVPPEARKEFEKADAILATQKKEQIPDAMIHLQKALTFYPKFLEAQLKLGATYMDLQQWDNAEQALKRALEINPKTVNAYLALGEVYAHQRKYSEAEKALRDGLIIEDRSWQGHFALGRLYYAKGDLARAGRQVGLAIQLNDSFPDAHLLAANIHLKVNNRQDALEQFQAYLRLAPKGEFAAQARQAVERLKR
jgi:predicted negative regulator of RcsB-dependent stress response